MKGFGISLSEEQCSTEGLYALGEITIGDFSESFHASLSYWTRRDYIRQWLEALNEITVVEKNKAAIISSMYDPDTANFIFCWVMYKLGDLIYLQNHILFLDDLTIPFDEKNIIKFVPDRELLTEEGEAISEWEIHLLEVEKSVEYLTDAYKHYQ